MFRVCSWAGSLGPERTGMFKWWARTVVLVCSNGWVSAAQERGHKTTVGEKRWTVYWSSLLRVWWGHVWVQELVAWQLWKWLRKSRDQGVPGQSVAGRHCSRQVADQVESFLALGVAPTTWNLLAHGGQCMPTCNHWHRETTWAPPYQRPHGKSTATKFSLLHVLYTAWFRGPVPTGACEADPKGARRHWLLRPITQWMRHTQRCIYWQWQWRIQRRSAVWRVWTARAFCPGFVANGPSQSTRSCVPDRSVSLSPSENQRSNTSFSPTPLDSLFKLRVQCDTEIRLEWQRNGHRRVQGHITWRIQRESGLFEIDWYFSHVGPRQLNCLCSSISRARLIRGFS